MGKTNKSALFPAITITIILLLTSFASYNMVTHIDILDCEFLDLSNHSAHSHSHSNYLEDDIPYLDPVRESSKPDVIKDYKLFSDRNLTRNFYSEIWRPPKKS